MNFISFFFLLPPHTRALPSTLICVEAPCIHLRHRNSRSEAVVRQPTSFSPPKVVPILALLQLMMLPTSYSILLTSTMARFDTLLPDFFSSSTLCFEYSSSCFFFKFHPLHRVLLHHVFALIVNFRSKDALAVTPRPRHK